MSLLVKCLKCGSQFRFSEKEADAVRLGRGRCSRCKSPFSEKALEQAMPASRREFWLAQLSAAAIVSLFFVLSVFVAALLVSFLDMTFGFSQAAKQASEAGGQVPGSTVLFMHASQFLMFCLVPFLTCVLACYFSVRLYPLLCRRLTDAGYSHKWAKVDLWGRSYVVCFLWFSCEPASGSYGGPAFTRPSWYLLPVNGARNVGSNLCFGCFNSHPYQDSELSLTGMMIVGGVWSIFVVAVIVIGVHLAACVLPSTASHFDHARGTEDTAGKP